MGYTQRNTLRQMLEGRQGVRVASVGNPISVRLAASLGFEAAMLAGSVAALEVLGAPDLVLLSASELADQTRRLCRVAAIPLLVDADHGYGNSLNVMRTVEELAAAGAAGITIEDTELPKKYAQPTGEALISLEEGVDKLRAALHARKDTGLVICARTSAVKIAGAEEAIRRARAYQKAGADAIFLSGVSEPEQLKAIVNKVSLPVILGAAGARLCDQSMLRQLGVSLYLLGHGPTVDAIHAMRSTYVNMMEGAASAPMKGLTQDELIRDLVDSNKYDLWMKDYMGAVSGA